ncbi:MAG: hypothetical protein IJ279_01865 [Clostridia bacterium]|nr:hypothetical protein [Clostridia bacterium]
MSKKILSLVLVLIMLVGCFAVPVQAREAGVGTGAESFNPVKFYVDKESLIGADINTKVNVEIVDKNYKIKLNSVEAYIPYYAEGGIAYLDVAYTKGMVISGAEALTVTGTLTEKVNSVVRYTFNYDILDKNNKTVWKDLAGYTYAFVSSNESKTGAVGSNHAYPGNLSDGCYFENLSTLNTTYVQQSELNLYYKVRTQSAWSYNDPRTRGVEIISGNAPSTASTIGTMNWPRSGPVYRSADGYWFSMSEPPSGYYNFTISFNSWNDDWEDQSNITETTEMYYIRSSDIVDAYNTANKYIKSNTLFADGYYVQKGRYTEDSWNAFINALDIAYQVALAVPNANHGYKLACINAQSANEALDAAFANLKEAEHDYYAHKDPVVTPATCTKEGSELLTCICGETKTNILPATGHTRGAWNVVKQATCTEEGKEEIRCTVCNEIVEEKVTPKIAHVFESEVTEADCTNQGYTTYNCTICGYTYTSDYVEPNGHEYNYVKIEPTCTEQGYTLCSCKNCNYRTTNNIVSATGHTEGEAVEENRTEATCTVAGSYDVVVYCSVCEEEISRETVVVDALGHTAGEAVEENRVEPTMTVDGSYEKVICCTVCNEELSRETVVLPMTGGYFREAEGSTTVINKELGLIYGLDIGLADIEEYVEYASNVSYELSDGVGTGSVVTTYRNSEEWESYTVVIFGDLNGDGVIDIYDASILAAIVNGDMVLEEEDVLLFAADLNSDTAVDIYDLAILNAVVNGETEISQAPVA